MELVDADVDADFSSHASSTTSATAARRSRLTGSTRPIETPLFGDEFVGRLHLPFAFPFYGETYSQLFISDNGYLNFLGPDQFNGFPIEIPSESDPNAAIYALWQDLHVDNDGAIKFETVGSAPDRAFVIAYDAVKAGNSSRSFELKLWENGDIDLLYDEAGTGENAGIGIENADGTDALQFGYLTDVLTSQSAYRFTEVSTGLVTGTVTDANDGQPIEGAVVEALDSGRSTETVADGTYELRLLPGEYDIEIRSDGYTTHAEAIALEADEVLVIDAALEAPIAGVAPPELDANVALGDSTEMTVTVSNTGSGPLDWEVRERPTGAEPPDLPEITGAPLRIPTWEKPNIPNLPHARTTTLPSEQLTEIIADPVGDGGSVDLVSVRAGADSAEITMELVYASAAEAEQGAGYVFLDVDQDPDTGFPAEFFAGLPTQDVGLEYFVDLFLTHDADPVVLIVDAETFEITAVTPARVEGDTIGFDVPLEAIGGDDGFVNTALVTGDFFQPTDWAPDEGHGTIEPFSDAPWVAEAPESGTVAAGDSVDVTVTLGGEDVGAGTYTGRLVFLTSDPVDAIHFVDLSLEVTLPAEFGGASGIVMDAHTGEPLRCVDPDRRGTRGCPVPGRGHGTGRWELGGLRAGRHLAHDRDARRLRDAEGEVTFAAGAMTPGQDVLLHRVQPHALIEGGPFTVVLRPGKSATRTIAISNFGGHEELTFETGEVNYDSEAVVGAASARRQLPAGWNPNAPVHRWPGVGTRRRWRAPVPRRRPGGLADRGGRPTVGCRIHRQRVADRCLRGRRPVRIRRGLHDPRVRSGRTPPGPSSTRHGSTAKSSPVTWRSMPERGVLWTVHIGGDNGLYAIDPADGSVEQVLTGDPWSDISQRGVAYDAEDDVFYVGGWNEGVVYRVAGPSWPTPGETLSSCMPADPNISGLAWNPSFDLLWMATNSEFDDIFLVDPTTCETLSVVFHPEPGGNGAGLELDASGNLWTVSQNSRRPT